MQMSIVTIKSYEKYQGYKHSAKKDSSRDKYIHNKRRAARMFKETMRQALINKYKEENYD